MRKFLCATLFLVNGFLTQGQTPYLYLSWTTSGIDSIHQYATSVNCGYTFLNKGYYEACAKIEEKDSLFFIRTSKGDTGFIYDLVITDSIRHKVMIVRIKEPLGFTVHIKIGIVRFQEEYFEPQLIPNGIEKGIEYFSFISSWNDQPINFKRRTIKTKLDRKIKRQLMVNKRK